MQRAGAIASLIIALTAASEALIVVFVVGVGAAVDPSGVATLARVNPAPLVGLGLLKLVSAAAFLAVVAAVQSRMAAQGTANVRAAALAGWVASALLSLRGLVSIFAVVQAAREVAQTAAQSPSEVFLIVTYVELFALLAYGLWYLLVCSAALRTGFLPRSLSTLGYALGSVNVITFLFPPAQVLSSGLGFVWSLWLGLLFWRDTATAPA